MGCTPFSQSDGWWRMVCGGSGEPHCEMQGAELQRVHGEVSRSAWLKRRERAIELFGVEMFPPLPRGPKKEALAPVTIEADIETRRLKKRIAELESNYKALLTRKQIVEEIREYAETLPKPTVPEPPPPPNAPSGSTEVALLRLADWHADEYVDATIMEGLNRLDPAIVAKRVQYCADRTRSICFNRFQGTLFEAVYVHALGDWITGALHEENRFTNTMHPFVAMVFVSDLWVRLITDLASWFPKVVVRAVPGNHWRYLKKVAYKMPTETSDWLIFQMVKARVSDLSNVHIDAPAAWSLVSEVAGWNFSLNHGYTDARGGYGGISYYSLTRSDAKRTAIDARLERIVHYRDYGHIHNEAKLPRPASGHVTIVPSLKGGDEYAKEGMGGTYSDPGQLLSIVNRQHGEWATMRLDVAGYDDSDEDRYMPALDVVNG